MNHTIWIRHGTFHEEASCNLLCFPYAGGTAGMFAKWNKLFGNQVNICPVLYPGRDIRIDEPVSTDIQKLSETFVSENAFLFEKPFGLLGYCAGGLYAYETVRAVKKIYQKTPAFFLSISFGTPAYQMTSAHIYKSEKEEELIQYLVSHHLIDAESAEDSDFLEYYLPILKGDMQAIDKYAYGCTEQLDCDIYAVFGKEDTMFNEADRNKWYDYTEKQCQILLVNGGHYCMEENQMQLVEFIQNLEKKMAL